MGKNGHTLIPSSLQQLLQSQKSVALCLPLPTRPSLRCTRAMASGQPSALHSLALSRALWLHRYTADAIIWAGIYQQLKHNNYRACQDSFSLWDCLVCFHIISENSCNPCWKTLTPHLMHQFLYILTVFELPNLSPLAICFTAFGNVFSSQKWVICHLSSPHWS